LIFKFLDSNLEDKNSEPNNSKTCIYTLYYYYYYQGVLYLFQNVLFCMPTSILSL
jgi:hypothetical protein